jgi:hypothetical protein
MGHPVDTQITLAHLSLFSELGCPKWADHGAAMASNAGVLYHINNVISRISEYGIPGAYHATRGIGTVLTGEGHPGDPHRGIFSLFQLGHVSVGNAVAGQIVLVHAGHNTGHAPTAPRDVKRKTELFHRDLFSH